MTSTIYNYNRRPLPIPDDATAQADIQHILSHFSRGEIGACLGALRAGTLDGNNPCACLYGVVALMRHVEFWQVEGESVRRPGIRWMVAYIRVGRQDWYAVQLANWLEEALDNAR